MSRPTQAPCPPHRGFSLIELLVVVVVLGVLAAIAIPSFLSQRDGAWLAAVESDIHNGAVSQTTHMAEFEQYAADVQTLFEEMGYAFSDEVGVYVADVDAESGFCLVGAHDRLLGDPSTYRYWDSSAAGVRDTACGSLAAAPSPADFTFMSDLRAG